MRRMRQNVIISHGGTHGPSSRTLRKGQAVTKKDMEQIPDHVLGQVTAVGVDAPAKKSLTTAENIRRRDAKIAVDEKAKGGKKPPKPKAEKPKAPAELPALPKPPEPEPPTLKAPTTKRALFLLKKADAVALLDSLGVPHDPDISSPAAKELLAMELGLAEKPKAEEPSGESE